MTFIQLLLPGLTVVGDGERVDICRDDGVPLDHRLIGAKLWAGHHGLVRHSTWIEADLSTHELFVRREYRNANRGLLDEVLPRRNTVPEYGTEHASFASSQSMDAFVSMATEQ